MKNIVITGPTCSGKTAAAVELAERTGGEIISADSRQVYRRMDIGTAKPSPAARKRAPHHLIDILEPDERYTAADFRRDAEAKIEDIRQRGKIPIIAGGTLLYIKALVDGIFEGPAADDGIRAELAKKASARGAPGLHSELSRLDPASACKIHPNDRRRLVRALEIYMLTGKKASSLKKWEDSSSEYLMFGLFPERSDLYAAINQRTDRMFGEGFVNEVKRLIRAGYSENLLSMEAVGYREIISFLKGDITLEYAREKTKVATRRYARRQLTWLRADSRFRRLEPEGEKNGGRIAERIMVFLP